MIGHISEWTDAILALAAWLLLAAVLHGEVVAIPATRHSGHQGVLGELEDRMPAQHQYRDADKGTWAHETTHGLNSRIRCAHGGHVNAAYLYGGYALILPEPSFTLADVAAATPQEWRGPVFGLYLVQQRGDWNNEPLYLLDELSAYVNGSVARLECGENATFSLARAAEMQRYAVVLYRLCVARGYSHIGYLNDFLLETDKYIQELGGRGMR